MLIGRRGHFILLPPFTKLSGSGINGRIVQVAFIKHLIAEGLNIEKMVYQPVDYTSQYSHDLNENVLIVTIAGNDGNDYNIPDTYIKNLYDDNSTYIDAYLTVRFGELPLNTDFAFIRNQVSKEASRVSGVQVADKDVSISISDRTTVYSHDEAIIKNTERDARIVNMPTDYGRLQRELSRGKTYRTKLRSMENKVKQLLGRI